MKLCEKFDDFIIYRKQDGAAWGTLDMYKRMYRDHIKPTLGHVNIEELQKNDTLRVKYSATSCGQTVPGHAIITLRLYLSYLSDLGIKLSFDWRDIKVPPKQFKQAISLDPWEVQRIRKCIDTSTHFGIRTRAMIEIILHSGLRIEEVISINRADIDFFREQILVKNCKNKGTERVSIVGATEWVKRYIDYTNEYNSPALFLSGTGTAGRVVIDKRYSKRSAQTAMKILRKKAGLDKHLHWHLIRKTFITTLLLNGLDIKSTQLVARHRSERTTLRHYAGITLDKAMELANRIMVTI